MNDDIIYGLSEVSLYLSNIGKSDFSETVEKACAEIERLEKENGTLKLAVQSMPNWLDEKRPEVVRCKDCKRYIEQAHECDALNQGCIKPDFYCGYGERKDGDGDD